MKQTKKALAEIAIIENALKNLLLSNTVICNKKMGIAASAKIAVDVGDAKAINELAKSLREGLI